VVSVPGTDAIVDVFVDVVGADGSVRVMVGKRLRTIMFYEPSLLENPPLLVDSLLCIKTCSSSESLVMSTSGIKH
jgi:hypothetical protein